MKFFRSYKYRYDKPFKRFDNRRPLAALVFVLALVGTSLALTNSHGGSLADASALTYRRRRPLFFFEHRYQSYKGPDWSHNGRSSGHSSWNSTDDDMVDPTNPSNPNAPGSIGSAVPAAAGQVHSNITTTYFWVGEEADRDNGGISNAPSAWDESWQSHYGGVDSPTGRNGYLPGGFTPKENPFYFALPYNDFTESGARKSSATNCMNSGNPSLAHYSWCKNTWIAISKNGKTVYAQWEDSGPFGEDDTAYVFGTAAPKNKQLTGAGLDVSPAVRDYLGLGDVDKTSWWFVTSPPAGPWTQIITTTKGDSN